MAPNAAMFGQALLVLLYVIPVSHLAISLTYLIICNAAEAFI